MLHSIKNLNFELSRSSLSLHCRYKRTMKRLGQLLTSIKRHYKRTMTANNKTVTMQTNNSSISIQKTGRSSEPKITEKALIVDDEATNRLVLSALLKQLNFQVVEAHDGLQALELFNSERPDIVFMDIMMPGIDGYEATTRIKSQCENRFVPIIVLTAITDEDSLAQCITAGGDDVLIKPFDTNLLKSKIHSMLRIRDLHRRISKINTQMKHEEELAEIVFSRAVTARNVIPEGLQILLRPASVFSGDMVLTAHGPAGDLHVLLGDFTGHGLSAAIGALPTAEVFRAMVAKGFGGDIIMSSINEKLYTMLPTDIFMSACYVHIPLDLSHVMLFNCGLPEVLVVNKQGTHIKHRALSKHFPLGIDSTFPPKENFERLELEAGDRLCMYSDGVIESRNPEGEEFGQKRLEQAIKTQGMTDSSCQSIASAIDDFCLHETPHDDVTLVEIPFIQELLNIETKQTDDVITNDQTQNIPKEIEENTDSFRFSMSLLGKRLQHYDPLPLIMNELHEMKLPKQVLSNAFTIISELLVNALDHGVLGLDSSLKNSANGFSEYLDERERRLKALQSGSVTIEIWGHLSNNGGRLEICVEDSGSGFDFKNTSKEDQQHNISLSGRGIALVQSLCHSLTFKAPGNIVEAVHTWTT